MRASKLIPEVLKKLVCFCVRSTGVRENVSDQLKCLSSIIGNYAAERRGLIEVVRLARNIRATSQLAVIVDNVGRKLRNVLTQAVEILNEIVGGLTRMIFCTLRESDRFASFVKPSGIAFFEIFYGGNHGVRHFFTINARRLVFLVDIGTFSR